MHLVPIPTTPEYYTATFHLWSPFLKDIASRSPWSVDDLLGKLSRIEVQPVLVMNDTVPVALLGVSFVKDNGRGLIGELIWMTGARRSDWQHLLTDVEAYLRDMKCIKCRPIVRPGWRRFLEQQGYEQVGSVIADRHLVMEKVL